MLGLLDRATKLRSLQGEKTRVFGLETQTAGFRTNLIVTNKDARDATGARWFDRALGLLLMVCVRRLALNGVPL
jgi:hypothetical protein